MSRYYRVDGDNSQRGLQTDLQAACVIAGERAKMLLAKRMGGARSYTSTDLVECTVKVLRDDGTVAATVSPA